MIKAIKGLILVDTLCADLACMIGARTPEKIVIGTCLITCVGRVALMFIDKVSKE